MVASILDLFYLGGPIQQKFFVNEESYYYIVGVTSFGSGCGSDVPGKCIHFQSIAFNFFTKKF